MFAASAAVNAWRQGPTPPEIDALQALYAQRWSLYDGSLFAEGVNPYLRDPAIYQNTKLILKHVESVVDFYAGVVYQGALSDEPEQGAIPWKLLLDGTVTPARDGTPPSPSPALNLWTAILELQHAWNWQQQMSLRPMYGAALGDCLVELVDDLDRRFVYPQVIWPGYVKAVEIDYVGNVRTYTLEYRVEEVDDDGNRTDSYLYRKTVDRDEIRTFKNDQPYGYDGNPARIPNPYGFCPAIWDRHRIGAPGMVRGRSATDGTRQALLQHNSYFSHALDFQRKAFIQPIAIASRGGGGATKNVNLSAPPEGSTARTAKEEAQTLDYIFVPEGSQYLQASMDIGKTREMLQDILEGILRENPEASFYEKLRDMQQVTAPGAERIMGDVKSRVDLVRAGMDANTVKLFQMAISMCAFRARGNEWKRRNPNRQLTPRQQVFVPFDTTAYDAGLLDCTILQRPLVPMTEVERVEVLALKESLQSTWALQEAGLTDPEIQAVLAERRAANMLLEDYAPQDGEAA